MNLFKASLALAALLLASCGGGVTDSADANMPVPAYGKPTAIQLTDATVTEGETAKLTLTESGGNGRPVTVTWKTSDGKQTGTVAGLTTKTPQTIFIPTIDDADVNGTRTLTVDAVVSSGKTGASTSAIVTINDNDVAAPPPPPPTTDTRPHFYVDSATVDEGAGDVTLLVHKVGSNGIDSKVNWHTENGTAAAGPDYAPQSGGFPWPGNYAGAMTVKVHINEDSVVEGDETINIVLSAETNAVVDHNGTITIKDNDVPVTVCPDGTIVKEGEPCAMPMPTTGGWVDTLDLNGIKSIPTTDFDPATAVVPMGVPPAMTGDTVGAFRFICGPGQVLADDPIVFPGQPGKSHLHQFYGNRDVNAYSTYASLRAHGDSTCNHDSQGHALNRSGYWMPALLDGKGNVVRPSYVTIYYKREPASHSECNDPKITKGCVPIPNGLKMIAGRNLLNMAQAPTGNFHYNCDTRQGLPIFKDNIPVTGYKTLAEVASFCPVGNDIGFSIDFPTCWDGLHVDSPDHMSHVGYKYNTNLGYFACPAATPYLMPVFRLTAFYHVMDGDDPTLWRLSSDAMAPNEPAGSTLHADYFEAWDEPTKDIWTKFCIDGYLSSTMGNLCNGTGLPGAAAGNNQEEPRLIPLSQVPKTPVR